MFDKPLPTEKLIQAIVNGDNDELRQALDEGADINADRSGNTPLILAASHGNKLAFNALIDAGANPNQLNHHGMTPAHEVAKRGHADLLSRLSQNPMVMLSRSNRAGNTPAHMAAVAGHLECLEVLATVQAALDEPGKEDKTPVMLAIDRQDMEMTSFLIGIGARLDMPDEFGLSARARLAAWPAAAALALSAPDALDDQPPSNTASPVQSEPSPVEDDTAPAEEFMGIGTIRKRRATP